MKDIYRLTRVTPLLKRCLIAITTMVMLAALTVFAAQQTNKVTFSGPPFDFEKSRELSQEKRQEYDLLFFNELAVWNKRSNRYGSDLLDPFIGRTADFKRMAEDGYLPAYVALRLISIIRGVKLEDPEALAMLLKAADKGDASAMCAFVWMPMNRNMLPYEESSPLGLKMEERGLAQNHPACLASRGVGHLFGMVRGIQQDTKAAMPLLLASAKQGYYVAIRPLFSLRFRKALTQKFDFSDLSELKRGLCWGRVAQQHTSMAGFDGFLRQLYKFAKANDRADLVELGQSYDPRLIPVTQIIVTPEDCIQLELGE